MKLGIVFGLAAVLAGNAQGAADVAVPLKPASKWVIGAEDGICTLSRRYGTPARRVVALTLKPAMLADTVRVVAVIPKSRVARSPTGTIQLTPLPAGTPIALQSASSEAMPDGGLSVAMAIKRDDSALVMAASGLVVKANGVTVRIMPVSGREALAELTQCETQVMKSWGLDGDATIASVDWSRKEAEWVSIDDYPPASLARGSEGTTAIVWQVNAAGRVEGCRTVKSAGDPELDVAACKAITRRGRYSPRLDEDGNAVPFSRWRLVRWRVPKP